MNQGRSFIIDSHQDIAWHVSKYRREFAPQALPARNNAMIVLPALLRGGVMLSCVTLFVEPNSSREARQKRLAQQLEFYLALPKKHPGQVVHIAASDDLRSLRERFESGERIWGFMLAMEGADLLDQPHELAVLHGKGLRMLSLTWNERNQWATGANHTGGLQPAAKLLLQEMKQLGMILDVSHLSRQSFHDALEIWDGPVCASHSNPAALCPHRRNLTDDQLGILRERSAVVGTLLYSGLLLESWRDGDAQQVPLSLVGEHIEYLMMHLGEEGVGIGSDFDGGLSARNTPEGLNTIADLPKVGEELASRGHNPQAVAKVLGGNWFQFLLNHLP